jgi:hypothetical protein
MDTADDRADPPPPSSVAATGVDAVRRLIVHELAESERRLAHIRHPRRPRGPRVPRDRSGEWRAATEAQMELSGQSAHDADATVTRLLNEILALSGRVEWFQEPDARARAIEESVAYFTSGRDVPSRAAHEWWVRSWNLRTTGPGPIPLRTEGPRRARWPFLFGARRWRRRLPPDVRQRLSADTRWLREWEAWYRDPGPLS